MMSADKWITQTPVICIWLVRDGRRGQTRLIYQVNTKRHRDRWCKDKTDVQGLKRRVKRHITNVRDFPFLKTDFYFCNCLIVSLSVNWECVCSLEAGQTYGWSQNRRKHPVLSHYLFLISGCNNSFLFKMFYCTKLCWWLCWLQW